MTAPLNPSEFADLRDAEHEAALRRAYLAGWDAGRDACMALVERERTKRTDLLSVWLGILLEELRSLTPPGEGPS